MGLNSPTTSDAAAPDSCDEGACAILVNARAGALHRTAGVAELQNLAEALGVHTQVVGTHSADEMCEQITRLVAEGAKRVAVAGGDGTIALAVQILAGTDTALGIIPQGTANNFATALGLPTNLTDPSDALRLLRDGVVRRIDLGRVGEKGRFFTESAGVGLFADGLALYGAGTNKNLWRALSGSVRLFLSLRARRIRLTIDGVVHSERAVWCEAANSFRMASALPIAPGANLTDGKLDIVVVGDLHRGELLPYYRAFLSQQHRSLPKVSIVRANSVKIEAGRPMNVHCDDKVVGATPITLYAVPRALKVLVPA